MLPDNQLLRADVAKDIAKVRAAYDEALTQIGDTPAATGVEGLKKVIDSWAKRGQDSADNNTVPSTKGWIGWQSAGQTYLNGIADISKLGKTYHLDAIVDTVRAIPKNVPKDLQNAAHTKAAKTILAAAGDMTGVSDLLTLFSIPWKLVGGGLLAFWAYSKFKGA